MSALEMTHLLGKRVALPVAGGIEVLCKIVDVKRAYGNTRFEIAPLCGQGRAWVNAASVKRVCECGATATRVCDVCDEYVCDEHSTYFETSCAGETTQCQACIELSGGVC